MKLWALRVYDLFTGNRAVLGFIWSDFKPSDRMPFYPTDRRIKQKWCEVKDGIIVSGVGADIAVSIKWDE